MTGLHGVSEDVHLNRSFHSADAEKTLIWKRTRSVLEWTNLTDEQEEAFRESHLHAIDNRRKTRRLDFRQAVEYFAS